MTRQQFWRSNVIPIELRCSTNSNACYGKHTHEEFSVGSVDCGQSNYFNNNIERKIKTGSLVIVNPLEVHSCNPNPDMKWSYKMLYVCPKWLGNIQSMIVENPSKDFIPFTIIHTNTPEIYWQFQSLAGSIMDNVDQMQVEEESIAFFSNLFGNINTPDVHKLILKKVNITKARRFIRDNFKNNISIREIAQYSGLSEYHLIHSFRKSYGITPHAMQISMRINEAKVLLKRGNNIASVATELGFNDQSHFHRNFKKLVAATPLQYKD
ncbi:AraC family transcriptional regulator [Vibrio mediterranei]